jgi:hypothetical protein
MSVRFARSELTIESSRLWFWGNRRELQLEVSFAYAFLLTLLDPELKWLKGALLQRFCPRTGKRSRDPSAPLYRLRSAMMFLFLSIRTPGLDQPERSG